MAEFVVPENKILVRALPTYDVPLVSDNGAILLGKYVGKPVNGGVEFSYADGVKLPGVLVPANAYYISAINKKKLTLIAIAGQRVTFESSDAS